MHGRRAIFRRARNFAKELGVEQVQIAWQRRGRAAGSGPVRIIDDARSGACSATARSSFRSEEGPVRERRKLAHVGIVAVGLALSRRGEMLSDPLVALDGVPAADPQTAKPMLELVLDAIHGTAQKHPPQRRRDADMVSEAVRRAAREQWRTPGARSLLSRCS